MPDQILVTSLHTAKGRQNVKVAHIEIYQSRTVHQNDSGNTELHSIKFATEQTFRQFEEGRKKEQNKLGRSCEHFPKGDLKDPQKIYGHFLQIDLCLNARIPASLAKFYTRIYHFVWVEPARNTEIKNFVRDLCNEVVRRWKCLSGGYNWTKMNKMWKNSNVHGRAWVVLKITFHHWKEGKNQILRLGQWAQSCRRSLDSIKKFCFWCITQKKYAVATFCKRFNKFWISCMPVRTTIF